LSYKNLWINQLYNPLIRPFRQLQRPFRHSVFSHDSCSHSVVKWISHRLADRNTPIWQRPKDRITKRFNPKERLLKKVVLQKSGYWVLTDDLLFQNLKIICFITCAVLNALNLYFVFDEECTSSIVQQVCKVKAGVNDLHLLLYSAVLCCAVLCSMNLLIQ
jgi:hypothetical protein